MVTLFAIALLCIGDTILLVRRCGPGFGQGSYSMVGGKVEAGETARQAVKREVLEEVALDIPESDFELVHTFHRKGMQEKLVALCFKVDISKMPALHNNEPDKHDDMRFFKLNELPENILPAHKQAIECIQKNISYSEHGWE
jgi:ADP-ribose pyrophosphatase YjhB (NUDIX family)